MPKQEYFTIKSIAKAFHLIEALVEEKEISLADLNSCLDFQKTTTHRILLTLKSIGYVEQNPKNQHYRASIKFLRLGHKVVSQFSYIEIAHPHLVKLAEQTGESINLAIRSKMDVVCVDRIDSKHLLKPDMQVGTSDKACCTSLGKAILAYLTPQKQRSLYDVAPISVCTPHSIQNWEELEQDLCRVRERGYAIDIEESVEGIGCVGAAIFDQNGDVIAGISISGPLIRINASNIPQMGKLIKEAAGNITRDLGGPAPKSALS